MNITLTFSVPGDAPLQTFEGTLHLRDSGESKKTYGKPLPITLNVWQVSVSQQGGYSLAFPPDFEISDASDAINLGFISPSTRLAINSNAIEAFDDISLVVVDNPEGLTASEFAKQYDDGWFESYLSKEQIIIGGRDAIRYSDIGSQPGHFPMIAIFIDGGQQIFIFTINRYESPESIPLINILDTIISTFEVQ